MLKRIGCAWFVSKAYYEYVDRSHLNWNMTDYTKTSFNTRISNFNSSKKDHLLWLYEIIKKDNLDSQKNQVKLNSKQIKDLALKIINSLAENKSKTTTKVTDVTQNKQGDHISVLRNEIHELYKKRATVDIYNRSNKIKQDTLERANGICELCNEEAPFFTKERKPFLEVHHIIALSNEGVDDMSNTVALCPNCHRKMHYGDLSRTEEEKIFEKLIKVTNKK